MARVMDKCKVQRAEYRNIGISKCLKKYLTFFLAMI